MSMKIVRRETILGWTIGNESVSIIQRPHPAYESGWTLDLRIGSVMVVIVDYVRQDYLTRTIDALVRVGMTQVMSPNTEANSHG